MVEIKPIQCTLKPQWCTYIIILTYKWSKYRWINCQSTTRLPFVVLLNRGLWRRLLFLCACLNICISMDECLLFH